MVSFEFPQYKITESGFDKGATGQVNTDLEIRQVPSPRGEFGNRCRNHPLVNLGHQREVACCAQECIGVDQLVAVLQSNQRFVMLSFTGLDVLNRLIVQHELVVLKRSLESELPLQIVVNVGEIIPDEFVNADAIAAIDLRLPTSEVCLGNDLCRRKRIVSFNHRNTDATTHMERLAVLGERIFLEIVDHLLAKLLGTASFNVLQKNHKLIATHTCNQISGANRVAKSLGHLGENQIATPMTESVVDVLKLVEINKQHRAKVLWAELFQALEEVTPIGETHELIVTG